MRLINQKMLKYIVERIILECLDCNRLPVVTAIPGKQPEAKAAFLNTRHKLHKFDVTTIGTPDRPSLVIGTPSRLVGDVDQLVQQAGGVYTYPSAR